VLVAGWLLVTVGGCPFCGSGWWWWSRR